MFERTFILTASVGCGHTRAAQAVQRALQIARPGASREPARIVDALEHVSPLFRRVYRDGYIAMVRSAPALVGHFYDRGDTRPTPRWTRTAARWLGANGIARLLEAEQPDTIVCTHFLPAGVVAQLKAAGRIDANVAVVITDIDAHGLWHADPCERYLVAGDSARRKLVSFGIDEPRIDVTGIPIDPEFGDSVSKEVARARLNLDADKPMLLVSGGGFGVGPLPAIVRELLKLRLVATIVAVAGKNHDAERRLKQLAGAMEANHPTTFIPLGFTEEMRMLMAASDLLVGKPGGLTSSEALACGLPMVIVAPVPGQEDRNADHLLELGVAVRCRDVSQVGWKVAMLIDDPERVESMRRRASASSAPRSAAAAARSVLGMTQPDPTSVAFSFGTRMRPAS